MDSGASHGHNFDTSTLHLDLYRLNCIFEASQPLGEKCSDDNPLRPMLIEHEQKEITRLVISISVFGRMLDDKLESLRESNDTVIEALEEFKQTRRWFREPVGELTPNVKDETVQESLTLREAFNKVLHATKMNFDVVDSGRINSYLRPYLYLYGTKGRKHWKATLNVYDFIRQTDILSWYM